MSPYDYGVIAFYFVFMLGLGWVAGRFIRNSSDYFRGGGQMVWWLVGASAFMTQFSAWTFTGAASAAYKEGWPIFVIYLANALGFGCNYLYFAARARQARVITAIEAVRERFSRGNEQVFTWLQIPMGTLYAGIWLNGLCVFLAAAFDLPLEPTIIVTGCVVLLMTFVGGSWAAVAGDFVQLLILMPVAVIAAILALIKVGGPGALAAGLPAGHLHVAAMFDSKLMLVWVVAIFIKQFISTNNLLEASRYLCVKDGSHARKASLLAGALFLIGPIVWFIPPLAAAMLFPDLHAVFPALHNPSEGAYVAVCQATMPAGMIGLLVSGIFAATMSSMDSGLNRNAGIFVKNFYQPVLRPAAPEAELVRMGRWTTAVMGLLIILAALNFSRMQGIGLFDLMLQFGTLVAVPYSLPLTLGVIFPRTPAWAGWSTTFLCLGVSLVSVNFFGPEWFAHIMHRGVLAPGQAAYWTVAFGLVANVIIGTAWFLASRWWWPRTPGRDRQRIDAFARRMETPVDFAREVGAGSDRRQARTLGFFSLAYGVFILLLAFIPNAPGGRLAFVGCGGGVALIGAWLWRIGRSREDLSQS
jgi:SSS family transporter